MSNTLSSVAPKCSWFFSRAPGNIVDWMYKRMGVKYSFAAHLRDTGTVSVRFESQNSGKKSFGSIYFLVWFCSARAMDTTGWRRKCKDGRIFGRIYRCHRQWVPLNYITVQTQTGIMTVYQVKTVFPSTIQLVRMTVYVDYYVWCISMLKSCSSRRRNITERPI